jgi:hypothetical protein
MIAILKFKLPEDQEDFESALKGSEYYCKLLELQNEIRKELKYNEKLSDESIEILERLRELAWVSE